MFSGPEIEAVLADMGITHVVWVPDSTLGRWEAALEASRRMRLVRVCREGEAWPLAGGLMLGGQQPLVMMQTTGLYESGDALRNVLFDLGLPIYSLIGVRNWLTAGTRDTATKFAEPIVRAWGLDCRWLESPGDLPKLAEHYRECRMLRKAGAALLAEGAG
jgi:sulfopyruvate decarboxylase subunit alpha